MRSWTAPDSARDGARRSGYGVAAKRGTGLPLERGHSLDATGHRLSLPLHIQLYKTCLTPACPYPNDAVGLSSVMPRVLRRGSRLREGCIQQAGGD